MIVITQEKYNSALYALHLILTRARYMVYKGEDHQSIAFLLDYAERLPGFIASREDDTGQFREYLEHIAKRLPACSYILDKFDESGFPESWR